MHVWSLAWDHAPGSGVCFPGGLGTRAPLLTAMWPHPAIPGVRHRSR